MITEASAPSSLLLTDLYQLTMLQGYFDQGMEEPGVFEPFARKLPAQLSQLPKSLQSLECGPDYPVTVAESVRQLAREVDAREIYAS